MPFIRIQAKEGRTLEQKQDLALGIMRLIEEQNYADLSQVRVIFEDMAEGDYYNGQFKDKLAETVDQRKK